MEVEAPHRDEAPSRLLERMRMRLLDLSARNPLLNYTHPRGSSLRIVDENLDECTLCELCLQAFPGKVKVKKLYD